MKNQMKHLTTENRQTIRPKGNIIPLTITGNGRKGVIVVSQKRKDIVLKCLHR